MATTQAPTSSTGSFIIYPPKYSVLDLNNIGGLSNITEHTDSSISLYHKPSLYSKDISEYTLTPYTPCTTSSIMGIDIGAHTDTTLYTTYTNSSINTTYIDTLQDYQRVKDALFYNEVSMGCNSTDLKRNLLKSKLKYNLAIKSGSNRVSLPLNFDKSEETAIHTLREVISEKEFRKYIRYGFIIVKGKSGDEYQVYRNRSHTKVWRGGEVIEEICVRIKSGKKIPPTDNVIAFKALIETDESSFKTLGNVYRMKAA